MPTIKIKRAVATVVSGLALAGGATLLPAAPASAQVPCGYYGLDYTHCANDTNVWIHVDRVYRADYERCVGPGTTRLDWDAIGAHYIGQVCATPGETRGVTT